MKVVSLFSGCGGLDMGFARAGFEIVYSNDFDHTVWKTYEENHGIQIDYRPLIEVPLEEIPDAEGIIGGPPCQTWSCAGTRRGMNDERGKAFYDYIRIIEEKRPLFFCAENVPGMVSRTHLPDFKKILGYFQAIGYDIAPQVLDARNYGVPQSRRRVFIIGYNNSLEKEFGQLEQTHFQASVPFYCDGKKAWVTIRDAIGDLQAMPAAEARRPSRWLKVPNHEYINDSLSTHYMSRDRRKDWDQPSNTIPAAFRHVPLHPDSTRMRKVGPDKWEFEDDAPVFRRFSIRECARLQTFPDDFIFYYSHLAHGYKMVGNAVPVELAEVLATQIHKDIS